jgi:hypothetical protein
MGGWSQTPEEAEAARKAAMRAAAEAMVGASAPGGAVRDTSDGEVVRVRVVLDPESVDVISAQVAKAVTEGVALGLRVLYGAAKRAGDFPAPVRGRRP